MSRLAAFGIGLAVAVSDIAAIVILTGFGQALADSAHSPTAPWWLMPAWLVTFFPAGLALWLPLFDHPMGLGPNDHIIWSSLILLNGVLWGATTYVLLRWAYRHAQWTVWVKTCFRLVMVIFIWFWSMGTALHFIDLYYLRGGDASIFGSPIFVLLAIIIAGVIYAAFFGPFVLRMLGGLPLGRQINISRILGVTLAVYVFVESFLGSNRNWWSFYLTLILVPMALGLGIVWQLHHRYEKEERLLFHA